MRNISWFILGTASALIVGNAALFAQEATRPPVQVVIGPDGVKVIDPRTGKEVPSVITRIPNTKPAPDKKTADGLKAIEEALRGFEDKKEAGNKQPSALEEHIMRALELQKKADKKKEAGKGLDKKHPTNPDAEIELRLERILFFGKPRSCAAKSATCKRRRKNERLPTRSVSEGALVCAADKWRRNGNAALALVSHGPSCPFACVRAIE